MYLYTDTANSSDVFQLGFRTSKRVLRMATTQQNPSKTV